eukprot:Gb_35014 [translate_table: standard]
MSIFSELVHANQTASGKQRPATGNATAISNEPHHDPISFVAFDIIVASLCIILAAFILCFCCMCKRLRAPKSSKNIEENSFHKCASAWTFAEVEVATDGFSMRRLLGKGRYATVYKAIFPDGQVMAVKRIDPSHVLRKASSSYAFSFSAEIKALSRAQHPNIVPVVGYCEAPAERIFMMDFMPKKTLEYHLHQGGIVFDWSHRLRIAAQAAQGIEYLHEGTAPYIIHGDIKPSNILLDSTWSARVADFGLSFLAPPNQMFGTIGYLDPEYYTQLSMCKASDIYSFGVVLLEILSGRPCFGRDFDEPTSIVDWAVPLITSSRAHEVFDPRLQVPTNPEPLIKVAELACVCVSNSRKNRPTILQVVAILNDIEREIIASTHIRPQESNHVSLSINKLSFRSQF